MLFFYRLIVVFMTIVGGLILSFMMLGIFFVIRSKQVQGIVQRNVIHYFCKVAAHGLGLKIDSSEVERFKECKTKPARLILANHISFVDVIVVGSIFKTSFLAKHDVAQWPIIGVMVRNAGILFVDRESVHSRVSVLRSLRRNLEFIPVTVFPEGTTTDLASPDKSLWKPGNVWAPCQYSSAELNAVSINYQDVKANAWVGDMDFFSMMMNTMKRKNTKISVCSKVMPLGDLKALKVRDISEKVFETITKGCETSPSFVFNKSSQKLTPNLT